MGKERNMTNVTSVAEADFVRAVTSAGASVKTTVANIGKAIGTIKVAETNVSSLPVTISDADITANHEVINAVLSNPSAQTGDWTVTTSAGSAVISGSISGTTNITLYLAVPR